MAGLSREEKRIRAYKQRLAVERFRQLRLARWERAKQERLHEPILHPMLFARKRRVQNRKEAEWAKNHPEVGQAGSHRRRAHIKGNGGSWTAQEWATLKRQYGHYCVGCWKHESELKTLGRVLSPDHIVPLSKGGLNHITNIQPLCHGIGGCNNKKGAKFHDFVIS